VIDDAARRAFAAAVAATAKVADRRVIDAFARVPREAFLGSGPWTIRGAGIPAPQLTATADPTEVLRDVSVALDASRDLYNGAPSVVAPWLEALAVAPGDRVVHLGAGTGYYSALLAELAGPNGRVDAIEVDAALAARAGVNLAPWPWARVTTAATASLEPGAVDAMLIHAGASHLRDEWLDALSPRGRLLVPLTCTMPGMGPTLGKGMTFVVARDADADAWPARMLGVVAIYSLRDLRDPARERALGDAFMRGGRPAVSSLRRDAHAPAADCWLHADGACLSSRACSSRTRSDSAP
jgi:protein-L-isoaspartate(D-aspartate) O-methyltransferase